MSAWCPQDYSCTFNLLHPRVVTHTIGPWWHGGGGLAVAIIAVIAICVVLTTLAYYIATGINDRRDSVQKILAERENKEHQRFIEEQRTMQIDAAKGNPEMLKVVRSLQT